MDELNLSGVIFDIQKFSVHDGPGIRTLVFFKGCGLNCLWCSNPEGQKDDSQLMLYPERCIDCFNCAEVCPTGATSLINNKIRFNRELCNDCGICADSCPAEARKIVGNQISVNELMQVIEKDRAFYRNSGGGVTFGGGEPLLQPNFIKAVCIECRKQGFNTALETCGYAPWENLATVAPFVDTIMFDLKHMDPVIHKEFCVRSNKLILQNLKKLTKLKKNIIVRIPIIPGYNDTKKNIEQTADLIKSLKSSISHVEILPYHKYGVLKYKRLGMRYKIDETKLPSDEDMVRVKNIIERYHIKALIV